MARPLALTTTYANLTGTQPLSLLDGTFAQVVAAINDPLSYSNYALDQGAANALVATFNPAVITLTAGLHLTIKVLNSNTGAVTLNANGTGAIAVVNANGTALVNGQLIGGSVIEVVYDGTSYVVTSFANTATGSVLSTLTVTGNATIGGTLVVTGNVTFNGSIAAASFSSTISVTGTATFLGGITLTGVTHSNNATDATSIGTGALYTDGGVGIAKALWVGGLANIAGALTVQGNAATLGTLHIANATDATSSITGALYTDGGVGIAKALWVGGLANIAGAVTLQSTLAVTGNANVAGFTCTGYTGNSTIKQAALAVSIDQQLTGAVASAVFTFAGGVYTLGWSITTTNPATAASTVAPRANLNSYTSSIGVYSNAATNDIYHFNADYITASPPYDLGDGEIPLFVFVLVDTGGKIVAISVAPDPIWANNGPTPISPAHPRVFDKDGKRFVWMPIQARSKDPAVRLAYLKGGKDKFSLDLWRAVEMTQAVKNADMPLIPHPFVGNDLTDLTPILLDPVNPIMERLLELHSMNAEGDRVTDLVMDGYLVFGNSGLKRSGPPGVLVSPVKWKDSL